MPRPALEKRKRRHLPPSLGTTPACAAVVRVARPAAHAYPIRLYLKPGARETNRMRQETKFEFFSCLHAKSRLNKAFLRHRIAVSMDFGATIAAKRRIGAGPPAKRGLCGSGRTGSPPAQVRQMEEVNGRPAETGMSLAPSEAPVGAARDARPQFRVAIFGLGHKFRRLMEIVLRHARHNRYCYVLAEARGLGEYDIALVDMTCHGRPRGVLHLAPAAAVRVRWCGSGGATTRCADATTCFSRLSR